MLFKTVYGSELFGLFEFLSLKGAKSKEVLYKSFIPVIDGKQSSNANLDDALSFLITSGIVEKNEIGLFKTTIKQMNFLSALLQKLRAIQLGVIKTEDEMNPWFFRIIDELFIKPNCNYLSSVHQNANQISIEFTFSDERINAWKRVSEFIGLGQRIGAGFCCTYQYRVWDLLLREWNKDEGPLQEFFEQHFDNYLPWRDAKGNVNKMVFESMLYLDKEGIITLSKKQDLPNRSYGNGHLYNWIIKQVGVI